MPTENYLLMVMNNEHMVDRDGVDDDGGEDGVERRTNLTPETMILVVAALCFSKSSVLLCG
jgi:hypothetical protein